MSTRMREALTAAIARDGYVLTSTRTHIALQRRGWVEGLRITEAGRRAVAG